MDESGTYGVECIRKVASGRRATNPIRSLFNSRDLQLEFPRVLHEKLLEPALMYGSATML